jgi:rhodanese-related sulfurtransferase
MVAERISPEQAQMHLESNPDALLVCAYDGEEKFRQNHLEGAISLSDFESRMDSTSKGQEIIFYCA